MPLTKVDIDQVNTPTRKRIDPREVRITPKIYFDQKVSIQVEDLAFEEPEKYTIKSIKVSTLTNPL